MEQSVDPADRPAVGIKDLMAKVDKEKLYDNLDILRDWKSHNPEKNFQILGADGRELFCHYACAVLEAQVPDKAVKHAALDSWQLLQESSRQVWAEKTPQMPPDDRSGLENLLDTEGSTVVSALLCAWARRDCEKVLDAEQVEESETKSRTSEAAREPSKAAQSALSNFDDSHPAPALEASSRTNTQDLEMVPNLATTPTNEQDIGAQVDSMATTDAENGERKGEEVKSDAKALFCVHAAAYLANISTSREIEDLPQDMWESLPENSRKTWNNSHKKMSKITASECSKYFVTDGSTNMSARFQDLVESTYRQFEKSRKAKREDVEQEHCEATGAQDLASSHKGAQHIDGNDHASAPMQKADEMDALPEGAFWAKVMQLRPDGESLFCHHAATIISRRLSSCRTEGDADEIARELWASFPAESREEWRKITKRLETTAESHVAQEYFNTQKEDHACVRLAQKQCRNYIYGEISAPVPALNALMGADQWSITDYDFVQRLLDGIRRRQATCSGLIMRGRGNLERISSEPDDTNVTSIAARLKQMQATSKGRKRYEELVKPFVLWNREAFPDISPESIDDSRNSVSWNRNSYRSMWLYHQKCYRSITPIKRENAAEVARAVVESVRERCEKVDPDSLLLKPLVDAMAVDQSAFEAYKKLSPKTLKKFSLHFPSEGLGAQVMRCFKSEGSAEEYEDRIEVVLWRFREQCRIAVFGDKETSMRRR